MSIIEIYTRFSAGEWKQDNAKREQLQSIIQQEMGQPSKTDTEFKALLNMYEQLY